MQPTCELLTAWAAQPIGFLWIDGHGWRDVQKTAANYLADDRRTNDPNEWVASAQRFIDAVNTSWRWCLEPGLDDVFETAVHPRVALFDQHRKQRNAA